MGKILKRLRQKFCNHHAISYELETGSNYQIKKFIQCDDCGKGFDAEMVVSRSGEAARFSTRRPHRNSKRSRPDRIRGVPRR